MPSTITPTRENHLLLQAKCQRHLQGKLVLEVRCPVTSLGQVPGRSSAPWHNPLT